MCSNLTSEPYFQKHIEFFLLTLKIFLVLKASCHETLLKYIHSF